MNKLIISVKETIALVKYFFSFKRRARLEEVTKRYMLLTDNDSVIVEWLQTMKENDLIHLAMISDEGLRLLAITFGTKLSRAGVESLKEIIYIESKNVHQYNSTIN